MLYKFLVKIPWLIMLGAILLTIVLLLIKLGVLGIGPSGSLWSIDGNGNIKQESLVAFSLPFVGKGKKIVTIPSGKTNFECCWIRSSVSENVFFSLDIGGNFSVKKEDGSKIVDRFRTDFGKFYNSVSACSIVQSAASGLAGDLLLIPNPGEILGRRVEEFFADRGIRVNADLRITYGHIYYYSK
jgi:hypothetical protein